MKSKGQGWMKWRMRWAALALTPWAAATMLVAASANTTAHSEHNLMSAVEMAWLPRISGWEVSASAVGNASLKEQGVPRAIQKSAFHHWDEIKEWPEANRALKGDHLKKAHSKSNAAADKLSKDVQEWAFDASRSHREGLLIKEATPEERSFWTRYEVNDEERSTQSFGQSSPKTQARLKPTAEVPSISPASTIKKIVVKPIS